MNRVFPRCLVLAVTTALLCAGCSRQSGWLPGGGGGPSVLGERLTARPIPDPQQGGLVVGVVAVPASWRFSSEVKWNYEHNENPVTVAMSAENPASSESPEPRVAAAPDRDQRVPQGSSIARFRPDMTRLPRPGDSAGRSARTTMR